jgi:hypothetical protein
VEVAESTQKSQTDCDVIKIKNSQKRTHLESSAKKTVFIVGGIKYQVSIQTVGFQPTLYRSSKNKDEISITKQQLDAFIWLYKQYGIKKPGWLRQKFYINRLRRSELNRILKEAGCAYCSGEMSEDLFASMHLAWHLINKEVLCI